MLVLPHIHWKRIAGQEVEDEEEMGGEEMMIMDSNNKKKDKNKIGPIQEPF